MGHNRTMHGDVGSSYDENGHTTRWFQGHLSNKGKTMLVQWKHLSYASSYGLIWQWRRIQGWLMSFFLSLSLSLPPSFALSILFLSSPPFLTLSLSGIMSNPDSVSLPPPYFDHACISHWNSGTHHIPNTHFNSRYLNKWRQKHILILVLYVCTISYPSACRSRASINQLFDFCPTWNLGD